MVLPHSNSRLSVFRKGTTPTKQTNMGDYMKKYTSLTPPPRTQSSSKPTSETSKSTVQTNKILDGVVACLDVRTEDGDDVSQNFERALQSMGAKTRRTFSDSVTHLIFKNGSPATLKKAIQKNVFIINLLWISRCKREGKRLPEKDFIIEKPQGLVLAGKKRRKSMEPGKVKALGDLESSLSSSSEGSETDTYHGFIEPRRRTIATSHWITRETNESLIRKRHIQEAEEEEEEEEEKPRSRLSLPISVESIANRHTNKKQKPMISANPPSEHMKEQIKARFSIGQTTSLEDPLLSLPTKTTKPTLVRRKRKLTGGIKLVQEKPTIVLTSMTVSVRKQCQDIVQKLGHYELATEVTEHTTHVLVGAQRRTKLLTLGIARGAWILRPDWLIQSDSRGQYVSEKEYQVTDWYPGIEAAHQRVPLIPHATRIKVVSSTSEIEFIEQLVVLLGGTVVSKAQEADIVITNEPNGKKKHVLDNWLFECIEQWQYLPINDDTEKIKKLE